jgi:hypothetical protein
MCIPIGGCCDSCGAQDKRLIWLAHEDKLDKPTLKKLFKAGGT